MQLGAGTSLPGLAAEKLGAYVTFSYDSTKLKVLDNMTRVCDLNKLKCNGLKCLKLLDGFSFLPSDKVSLLSGNIQMAEIDLSHNKGLTGSLPHSIGNLTKLSNLFLVDCGFIGPIPDEIGPLKELVFF
ncbi:hypothetical protein JHK87_042774 [Glycine soja]|nr:hypothetical protein JHK87_042774 [Glycine soja]